MKFVRTARGYQSLKHGEHTVTGQPLEVSNDDAKALEKLGAENGVTVLVFDKREDAQEGLSTAVKVGVAAPDLSAGRAAVFGTGDPVQTLGVAEGGGEPEQADAQDGAAAGGSSVTTTSTTTVKEK